MRICILGSKKSQETELLLAEAKKHRHQVRVVLIDDLIFIGGRERVITYQGDEVSSQFDVFLVRGLNRHPDETLLLCNYLFEKGKVVVDQRLADKRYYRTKLATAFKFADSKINYPATYFISNPKKIDEVVKKVGFPLIVKEAWGMHSHGVLRFKRQKGAENFFKDKKGEYLIQKDLKENEYYRVFVIGDEVVGAMKRTKKRPLSSRAVESGVKSARIKIDEGLESLALRAAKLSGNDISGLDFIKHEGNYYLLEANRSPQFRVLSKITGINIAAKIINYLEDKFKKK
ncbi:MAG: alpha-L-glutamate ligase [Candidatus Berkelbacteria bacterium Licking1014_96]|uniref:Alpha-L-glutamate ligase n=1 Tax=Candidatus Berkelbacteria bacterium Licking1014_96 TaxID=2017149 RepID=A0A554LD07_9BACT|nr:MAG: alpha-L-glutamate ligase [Candidatus Berkelbacteria bacterium Licking1014_96]